MNQLSPGGSGPPLRAYGGNQDVSGTPRVGPPQGLGGLGCSRSVEGLGMVWVTRIPWGGEGWPLPGFERPQALAVPSAHEGPHFPGLGQTY